MKLSTLLQAAMASAALLALSACQGGSPVQPVQNNSSPVQFTKPGGPNSTQTFVENTGVLMRYRNNQGSFHGGRMSVPSGSSFEVANNAYTAPEGTPPGQSVELTMEVTKDEGGLHFEFGPHGSRFDPPAELWFDWHDLGSKKAKLYYIDDDGQWIPQQPDFDDKRGKRFMLLIDHFSRYAIAQSQ